MQVTGKGSSLSTFMGLGRVSRGRLNMPQEGDKGQSRSVGGKGRDGSF